MLFLKNISFGMAISAATFVAFKVIGVDLSATQKIMLDVGLLVALYVNRELCTLDTEMSERRAFWFERYRIPLCVFGAFMGGFLLKGMFGWGLSAQQCGHIGFFGVLIATLIPAGGRLVRASFGR